MPCLRFWIAPQFSETPAGIRRLPPRLGEHNWDVLREAGLDDEEILQISP